MKYLYTCIFFSFLLLTSVKALDNPTSKDNQPFCACEQKSQLFDLNESVEIILSLIQGDSFGLMLENADPKNIELILKNFSPAEIAFQAEVINSSLPTLLFFSNENSQESKEMKTIIESAALSYNKRCKFIEVNSDKLFKISHITGVMNIPALVLLHNGVTLDHITGTINHDQLHDWIDRLLNEIDLIK